MLYFLFSTTRDQPSLGSACSGPIDGNLSSKAMCFLLPDMANHQLAIAIAGFRPLNFGVLRSFGDGNCLPSMAALLRVLLGVSRTGARRQGRQADGAASGSQRHPRPT